MQGRYTGSPGGHLAREYILGNFIQAQLQPGYFSSYMQPFIIEYGDSANVIGMFPGQDPALADEVVIASAHYDHLGIWAEGIMHGAHDNAAAVAALMEAARAVSMVKSQLRRTVLFIAFDAEEQYMVGSYHYTREPTQPPLSNTVYVMNMDVAGYLSVFGRLYALCTNQSSWSTQALVNISTRYPRTGVPALTPCRTNSDHLPFMEAGVPVVYLTSGQVGTPYHTTYDTADGIDYPGLTDITRVLTEMIWTVSQDDRRP